MLNTIYGAVKISEVQYKQEEGGLSRLGERK